MEESTFVDQGQSSTPDSAPAEHSAPVAEKMVPQSVVDNAIKRAKYDAEQRGVSRERSRWESQQAQSPAIGGITQDDIRRIAAEESDKVVKAEQQNYQRQMYDAAGKKIAGEFRAKLEEGRGKYDDFDDVVGAVPFAKYPHTVALANNSELTADIMYELANNPVKLQTIENLARDSGEDPRLAMRAMNQLVDSIKINQQAKNTQHANAPLTQIRHSPTNNDGDSSRSVKDFQKIFRL